MRRVWVVDDTIPIHELYDGPFPVRLDAAVVKHLVEQLPREAWSEPEVLDLCATLSGPLYESAFFLSPDAMLATLSQGALPPHAVVFDWEYPGSSHDKNLEAIELLLGASFAYVQVYTHLGAAGVEPQLAALRDKFGARLLPVRAKADVTPSGLATEILEAWTGTIAGETADRVRDEVFKAVERSLIEMCSVPRGEIASLAQGMSENLVHLVLSKVRDEISIGGLDVLEEIAGGSWLGDSSVGLRRLMSVWYYFFPADNFVRRGDLIEIEGSLGFVVTPECHLDKFAKKTGRHLTWLHCVRVDEDGLASLRADGYEFDGIGGSIIAAHGKAGDALIVLPNVPDVSGSRELLSDHALLCHSWGSRLFRDVPGGRLKYDGLPGIKRRCTLVDPFASAVVTKISAVMSSAGMPDLPKGEQARLRRIATPDVEAAKAPK